MTREEQLIRFDEQISILAEAGSCPAACADVARSLRTILSLLEEPTKIGFENGRQSDRHVDSEVYRDKE